MISATPEPAAGGQIAAAKAEWVQRSVARIEVGDGVGPDGGFIS